MADENKIQLMALWENTSKSGAVYMTGTLGRNRIVAFKNNRKEKDSHPDWLVYLQERPEEERQGSTGGGYQQQRGVTDGPRGTLVVNGSQHVPADNSRPPEGMF